MTPATLTLQQIVAQVAAIRQKIPDARIIGLRAAGRWTHGRTLPDGLDTMRIEQCDSPLHMRLALQDDDGVSTHVLITSLDDREISEDIRLRLTRRRLFPLDSWGSVKSLFQAHKIDPRVTQYGWMADALLDVVTTPGFTALPAPGGFLDAETVWSLLLQARLGLTDARPDLLTLLNWASETTHVQRLNAAREPFREAATAWFVHQAGPIAGMVIASTLASQRPDALAVGLAAGVVFHEATAGSLDRAVGRMEARYFGGQTLDTEMIQRWYAAAREVVTLQLSEAKRRAQLQRADDILRDVQADAYAYLSDVSPLGFDQRLERFGHLLARALQHEPSAMVASLTEAQQHVAQHDRAQRERRRLDRIDMAIRLVRWLASATASKPAAASLPEAAAHYLTEGGFVDWARLSLRAGDPERVLSEAYARLFARVTEICEAQAHHFANLLRDWTAAGSTGSDVVPVERLLDEIVAPLAAQAPVLVVVLDGMSVAVCRELVEDIARQDWVALCEDGRHANRPGLAAIPSVTEVSRTSLLCGDLSQGGQAVEQQGFAAHPGLLAHSRRGAPPRLFHKAALQEADDASLAADVRQTMASLQHRVVGVVVNAIDDHLLKGEQIDVHWSRDEIKVLPALLHEARAAGRVVVMVSDHGHVLEHQTQERRHEGGERWRMSDSAPAAGEVQIAGRRVVMPDTHQLIAPWTEHLRYGAKKNGYHGGLSPQEMIIPITVLCAAEPFPRGWVEAPIDMPVWWDEAFDVPTPPDAALLPPPGLPSPPEPLGPLFDFARTRPAVSPSEVHNASPPSAIPAWVAQLLASPILQGQKSLAGRAVPDDAITLKLLVALDHRGGKLTSTALARAMDYPPFRLRGLLAVMQRLFNIDGYPVLTYDQASDTITLNRELLFTQFEIIP